jgi:hypothetical protein
LIVPARPEAHSFVVNRRFRCLMAAERVLIRFPQLTMAGH